MAADRFFFIASLLIFGVLAFWKERCVETGSGTWKETGIFVQEPLQKPITVFRLMFIVQVIQVIQVILFWLMRTFNQKESGTDLEKPFDICWVIRMLLADAKEQHITETSLPQLLEDLELLVGAVDDSCCIILSPSKMSVSHGIGYKFMSRFLEFIHSPRFKVDAGQRVECNTAVKWLLRPSYMVTDPFECASTDYYTSGPYRVFPIVPGSDAFQKLNMTEIGEILEKNTMSSQHHTMIHLITRAYATDEDKKPLTSIVKELQVCGNDEDKEARTSLLSEIEVHERDEDKDVTSLMNEFPYHHHMNEDKVVFSLSSGSRIYGRDEDKEAIVKMLLGNELCSNDVSVIPVVGPGGIGKTTLVELVYNDRSVTDYFHLKAWVSVREELDVFMVTSTVFEAMTSQRPESMNLNVLQLSLKEKVSRSKFLLVLDDVLNVNREQWDVLYHPFQFGLPGSRFIVITRNNVVASMVGSARLIAYHMKLLTDDDCLAILSQHSFRSFSETSEFEEVGKELSKRCKGLPLATKVLGSLLRYKEDKEEWDDLLNSNVWNFHEENDILPVLRLSYLHLPPHLKYLFAFCSLLPKGCELDTNDMLSLWIREGLLDDADGRERKEELGHGYLNELFSRSFLQRSNGCESLFLMHDLIHDLAQFVAGGKCYRLNERTPATNQEPQLTEDDRLNNVLLRISQQPLGF